MIKYLRILTLLLMVTVFTIPFLAQAGEGEYLSVDITTPEDGNFNNAVKLVTQAGVNATTLTIYWDDFEKSPGVYKPTTNWLQIAKNYYPAAGLKLGLVIAVIDTNKVRLPADLQGRRFSDPVVVKRFNAFLDYTLKQLPATDLVSVSIGNEVDGYLGSDKKMWSDYQAFYKQSVQHVHKIASRLPVGVKGTFDGLTKKDVQQFRSINRYSDYVMVTYYPLTPQYTVRPISTIGTDFDTLMALYPSRSVSFDEAGYPSSADCGSSVDLQAQFVHQMFAGWVRYRKRIPLLNFNWLHDYSPEATQQAVSYYGVPNNAAFAGYIDTLGLRTYPRSGTDKLGFNVLQKDAAWFGFKPH